MRTTIYNYIDNLNLGSFKLSPKLPWDDNGSPLYHHNKKHIYVDQDQTSQNSLINTFSGPTIVEEQTLVTVYFVNDAKQIPAEYDSLVASIKNAISVDATGPWISRQVQVDKTYEQDCVLTKLEFSFKKILTN